MAEFSWRPGIGDPTVGGWVTVVLYFFAVWATWRAAQVTMNRERILWLSISTMLVALGINKQLDLQSALTDIGRIVAVEQGWYETRQIVQIWFIIGVAVVCSLIALTLIVLACDAPLSTWGAIAGMAIVLAFVLIRAASFHRVDQFIGQRILGLKWNWILEMGGISIVLLSAIRRRHSRIARI